MELSPKQAEHLLETCVWRRFKERFPIGLSEETVGFPLYDAPEEERLTVTVTQEGESLKFEVYSHAGDYHVFER